MKGRTFADVAHRLLQAELRSRGLGTITAVEDALGWNRRSIRRMRQQGVLRVADLVDILDQLGIRPSTFNRRVEEALEQGTTSASWSAGLACLPQRSHRDDETVVRLSEAEELRYNDPVAALRAVSDLRPQISRTTAHWYYAVGGSCYRSLDLFDKARACLKVAFEAAGSERELAVCHQRMAWTHVLEDPKIALAEAEHAHDLYSGDGDATGSHTALVDIANFYYFLGRFELIEAPACRALGYDRLPARNVVAAHQVRALGAVGAGNHTLGIEHLERGLAAAAEVTDRSTTGNLLLLAGRMFRSVEYLEMSIETFGQQFPFNALSVALEKCQLLEDVEAQKETMRSLRAYCRHPAYQRFLDHVYSYVHMGRFANHTFDFSGIQERWCNSQTRRIKI